LKARTFKSQHGPKEKELPDEGPRKRISDADRGGGQKVLMIGGDYGGKKRGVRKIAKKWSPFSRSIQLFFGSPPHPIVSLSLPPEVEVSLISLPQKEEFGYPVLVDEWPRGNPGATAFASILSVRSWVPSVCREFLELRRRTLSRIHCHVGNRPRCAVGHQDRHNSRRPHRASNLVGRGTRSRICVRVHPAGTTER